MPSETESRAKRAEEAHELEEDTRLRNDIRLLGRILGDTVRDQEGADVFDLVERIRQTSIRFHRDEDKLARRELETILDGMSTADTVRIVRAFSYFSHLANIAEDQNNIRQMRGRGPGGPRASMLAETLAHAKAAGIGAAHGEQLFNQDGGAFRFQQNVAKRLFVFLLAAGAAQGQFGLGARGGNHRYQLLFRS